VNWLNPLNWRKKLKIVFSGYHYFEIQGGVERLIQMTAEHMLSRGHDITVVGHKGDLSTPSFPLDPRIKCELFPFDETELYHYFSKEKPDIVVGTNNNPWLHRTYMAAMRPLPIAYLYSEQGDPFYWFSRRYDIKHRNSVMAQATGIHMGLPQFRASLPESWQNIRIIQNTFSDREAPFKINPAIKLNKEKIIIQVARIVEVKKQDLLIEAFRQIHEEFPDWKVHLYGTMMWEKPLQMIRDFGLSEKVIYKGASDNIFAALASAQIAALPSDRSEALPLVLAEYLSHGLPVVGYSEVPAISHLIKHGYNGIHVDRYLDASAFAGGLRTLMQDHDLRVRMSRNAIRSYEKLPGSKVFYREWEKFIHWTHKQKLKQYNVSMIPERLPFYEPDEAEKILNDEDALLKDGNPRV